MGDYGAAAPWDVNGIKGCKRFLDRVEGLFQMAKGSGVTPSLETAFHKTIKKVTGDLEELKHNTAIAAMMSLINEIYDNKSLTADELGIFTRLLCPFAPHLAEEIWHETLGKETLCSLEAWPEYDEAKTVDSVCEYGVQFCGKIKGKISLPLGIDKDSAIEAVKSSEEFSKFLEGKEIVKEIFVPNKLINIVVK